VPPSVPDFEANVPVKDWTSVQFLHAKQGLKVKSAEQNKRFEGKGGMVLKLKKALESAKLKNCDLADMPQDATSITKELHELKEAVSDLDVRVMTCVKATFEKLKGELAAMTEKVDALALVYDELFSALQYKIKARGDESRKEFQTGYWQKQKRSEHLVKGGAPRGQATFAGKGIANYDSAMAVEGAQWFACCGTAAAMNPSPSSFDKSVPTFFFRSGDGSTEPEGLAFFTSIEDYTNSKKARLLETMNENPRWVGACGSLPMNVDPAAFEILKPGVSTHDGARPNVLALRNNARRHGPIAIPFAGQAAIWNACDDAEMWLHLFAIDPLLAKSPHKDTFANEVGIENVKNINLETNVRQFILNLVDMFNVM
jgi:hypothetical protein